jgi:hypothetical protein
MRKAILEIERNLRKIKLMESKAAENRNNKTTK